MTRQASGRLSLPVNGEDISVFSPSHLKCPKCGEVMLRPDESRRLHDDVTAAYRKKHALLSGADIRAIREQFALKQSDLARLLKLGANTVLGGSRDETCRPPRWMSSSACFATYPGATGS